MGRKAREGLYVFYVIKKYIKSHCATRALYLKDMAKTLDAKAKSEFVRPNLQRQQKVTLKKQYWHHEIYNTYILQEVI